MLNLKNTLDGYLKNVEVIGNTVQDTNNLADIRSVGDKVEGQELYKIDVVSCGKNLFNGEYFSGYINETTGVGVDGTNNLYSNFIKVTPNTNYNISYNVSKTTVVAEYSNDKTFIKRAIKSQAFRTGESTYYIRFQNNFTLTDKPIFTQLEYGTQSTPYEPYKENKLEILSPVQLEKVGDVADRIICKDGVWGVEKNVIDKLFNGSENWVLSGWAPQENTIAFKLQNTSNTNLGICDKFILNRNNSTIDTEAFNVDSVWNEISVRINKSKLSTQDVTGFKKWLSDNTVLIMYSDNTSTFTPLPHDQQVKLRTFAGQTNIAFLTEIPGQIKAQVPKSLGATVNTHTEQIADLHNSLDRVKKLEETTVSTIETGSSFTTVDATSNGYFEDVKLEGKTLVNVLRLDGNWFEQETTLQTDSTIAVGLSQCTKTQDLSLLKNNTMYTVIPFIDYTAIKKGNLYLQLNTEINGIQNAVFRIDEAMFNKPTLITTKELTNKNSRSLFLGGANCEYKVKNVKILMLEGDHTNNPPSYFEGLMSVGQDVEEVNVESVNENLFSVNEFVKYCGGSVDNNVYCNTNAIADNIYPVFLPKGSTISWHVVRSGTANTATPFLGINKNGEAKVIMSIGNQGETKNLLLGEDFYGIQIKKWSDGYKLSNIQVRMSKDIHNYIPHKLNKKPLLYFNPTTETWEKPILREWDTIEKHSDGKYYYHKRSGEVVLNGSENWVVSGKTNNGLFKTTYSVFLHNINTEKPNKNDGLLIPNNIQYIPTGYNGGVEGTYISNNSTPGSPIITYQVDLSKLSTQDVVGFKAWLKDNPTTVVYQLAQEEVYECTNIDLMTYSGETNYIINSGAISPKSLLKVHNNISNVVKILQEKVSLLENTFIAGLKSVLSGDMYSLATILYPEDFEQNDNIEQDIMVIPE